MHIYTCTYKHHTHTHTPSVDRVIAEDGGADISQAREVGWLTDFLQGVVGMGELPNVQNYPCSVISKHELAAGFV